jgi:hypothetical protein
MLSKPTILSDRVGNREMFDAASCFIFEPVSAPALARQLLTAYERREDLKRMGLAARRRFEQELTLDAFGERFLALVSRSLETQRRIGATTGRWRPSDPWCPRYDLRRAEPHSRGMPR